MFRLSKSSHLLRQLWSSPLSTNQARCGWSILSNYQSYHDMTLSVLPLPWYHSHWQSPSTRPSLKASIHPNSQNFIATSFNDHLRFHSSSWSLQIDLSCVRHSTLLEDFLQLGRNPNGDLPQLTFEQVSFNIIIIITINIIIIITARWFLRRLS